MIMTLKWNRRKKGGAERVGLTLFRAAVQFLPKCLTEKKTKTSKLDVGR
jgi:hypothetical protein